MSEQRLFFHVDINSYFATMIQQELPATRGKPLGVVKSAGRTCLIATSKEAKKLGVGTGTRLADARVVIPDIVVAPVQFEVMLDCTYKLQKIFQEFCPEVSVFSLDEAFLDMTSCIRTCFPSLWQQSAWSLVDNPEIVHYGQKIQARIKEVLGDWVTCTVGVSTNHLLAKMAGETGGPGNVAMIDSSNLDAVLASVQFKDVCGVGFRLAAKLAVLGVHSPWEINLLDNETLRKQFGPFWSVELRKIGLGQETHFFSHPKTVDHMQSVGRTITGYGLCDDEVEIKRVLLNLLEEATAKLRAMDLVGRRVGVGLWGHDRFWHMGRTLQYYVRHSNEIFPILYDQLYRSWQRNFPVIKYGIWISLCAPLSQVQEPLFPEWHHRKKIYAAVDKINTRYGQFTVMPATLLGGQVIKREVTGFLGDKKFLGLG